MGGGREGGGIKKKMTWRAEASPPNLFKIINSADLFLAGIKQQNS